MDYAFYNNTNKRDQVNTYYSGEDRDKLSEHFNYFNTPSEIDILTLKLDYEHAAFKGKLGYGAKLSRVVTDNTYQVYDGKRISVPSIHIVLIVLITMKMFMQLTSVTTACWANNGL